MSELTETTPRGGLQMKDSVLACSERCENTTNTHNNTVQSTSSRGGGTNHLNQVERHVSLVIEDQLAGARRDSRYETPIKGFKDWILTLKITQDLLDSKGDNQ